MPLPPLLLESLESRIAPAVILAGPTTYGGQQYTTPSGTPFHTASSVPVQDGTLSNFSDALNFYIPLKSGDTLKIYNQGTSFANFITVSGGAAEAFFTDSNGDGIPQSNELSGLSLSAGAKLSVSGNVNGDIVANLNAKTLSDPGSWTISANNLVSNKQNIAGLTVGNVTGNIIAGGAISNLVAGTVGSVRSGISGSTPYSFGLDSQSAHETNGTLTQFSSDATQGSGYLPAAKLAGGALSGITVNAASGIYGGGGGAGAAGGAISNVTVSADSNGITIAGGAGGTGSGSVIAGGAGGTVSQVVMSGVNDTTDNSLIQISGGNGGAALAGSTGAGGAGGFVSNVWVGYQSSGGTLVESSFWLHDNVTIQGGNGGAGVTAGNGGGASGITLLTATPYSSTHDIQVLGGAGGDLFAAGKKAGAGGSVTTVKIKDLLDTQSLAASSSALVAGGNASSTSSLTATNCVGAAGGSVTNPVPQANQEWFVGENFTFLGGNGTSGTQTGGAGGSVSNLQFGSFAEEMLQNLVVTAGTGGSSTTGNGGAGGDISGITAPSATMSALGLTAGAGGNSGNSSAGAIGGRGGNINSVNIFDSQPAAPASAFPVMSVTPAAGNGGNGFKGGGAGGSVQNVSFFYQPESLLPAGGAALAVTGGNGGSTLGSSGAGGAGGLISGIAFSSLTQSTQPLVDATQTATLTAGNGGNGAGAGAAGAGGAVTKSNLQAEGNVTLTAGVGGNSGDKGKIGAGGTVGSSNAALGVFGQSAAGSVTIHGGNAGAVGAGTPATGAAGGSILNASASAALDISLTAGNGSIGGNGGDITQVAFYGASGTSTSAAGNISVIAGVGGDAISATSTAGRGGNLTNAAGYTSSGVDSGSGLPDKTVLFEAGNGGSASSGGRGGAGGSVNGLTLYGGSNTTEITTTYTTSTTGSTTTPVQPYPSTTTVNADNVGVDPFAVRAGTGGSGTLAGGLGGSVSNIANGGVITTTTTTDVFVNINTDTGVRTETADTPVTTQSTAAPVVYAVAAGDGGNTTTGKGANGGSITNVNVAGDIGIRTGQNYGYALDGTKMGGIFAGQAGINTVTPTSATTTGTAGNVSTITAQAISAIVAGKGASPQLVNKVDGIILSGNTPVTEAIAPPAATGSYSNFLTANLVGGKAGSPTSANAVDFHLVSGGPLVPSGSGSSPWTLGTTQPLDGLIAALTLTSNRNFTPLAFLTTDPSQSGGYGLYLPPVPVASA